MTSATDIEMQAARWLVQLDADDSPEQRAKLDAWLNLDARNRAAYLRLEEAWKRADVLRRLRPLNGPADEDLLDTFVATHPLPGTRPSRLWGIDEIPPANEASIAEDASTAGETSPVGEVDSFTRTSRAAEQSQSNKRNWTALAVAAACITVGVVLWMVFGGTGWQVYETDLGGFQRIALRDGSTVHLNTDSEIRVRFTDEKREVALVRGEALFTVFPDTDRPFDVTAGNAILRAVGTAFSVRLRNRQQIEVMVSEGRVAVDTHAKLNDVPQATENIASPDVPVLSAGDAGTVEGEQLRVAKLESDTLMRRLAWTQGRLWFHQTTLADAAAEFNRYNHRQLVVDDAGTAQIRIGGGFEATDLDSFVQALEKSFGVRSLVRRATNGTEIIHLIAAETTQ